MKIPIFVINFKNTLRVILSTIMILATYVLLISCNLTSPLPQVLNSSAQLSPDNSLIVKVNGDLDGPSHVFVEYWNSDKRLRSKIVESNETRFEVDLFNLKAETAYEYQVFTVSENEKLSSGPVSIFETGELPETLKNAEFNVISGKPTKAITFLEFRVQEFMGLVAYDQFGDIVWYYEGIAGDEPYVMDRKSNGNIVYIAGDHSGTTATGLVEITPDGKEVSRLNDICTEFGPMHHEIQVINDSEILYMSRIIGYDGYGDNKTPQEGDTIGIWNQKTGANSIVWNIFDFVNPSERTIPDSNATLPAVMWGGCDRNNKVQDWSHGNSAKMYDNGDILATFKHLDQVILIDKDYKNLKWRLGGPGSDFTFPNKFDQFYDPHDATLLENGNILLLDNGNGRPFEEGGPYSRILELAIDTTTMTARKVWQYTRPPLFAPCCGTSIRLANGNTVMLFGMKLPDSAGGILSMDILRSGMCCGPFYIFEVDSQGNMVWEVEHSIKGQVAQYRVFPDDSIMGEIIINNTPETAK